MPWGSGDRLRRMLSGLLILSIVLMSVAQVNVLMAPGVNVFIKANAVPEETHRHVAPASPAAHDHADRPCEGHERSHGAACCLSTSCPVLVVALQTAAPVPMPTTPIMVSNLNIASVQPDGIGRAPDLPPPRHIA